MTQSDSLTIPYREIQPRPIAGGYLQRPLTAVLSRDENGRYLMVDPAFSIHGEGDTAAEAEESLLNAIIATHHNLSRHEERLSPRMRQKLDFVKTLIALE